jgi:cytochrome c biogenesis protein CcmG/thiol:disulfide interchange protein DsbE
MVLVMAILLGVAIYRKMYPFNPPAGLNKGHSVPDLTLTDTQGHQLSLSQFRGKVVVVNFWATWCPPCKEEIPWFVEMQRRYGAQGVQVVGISMDEPRDRNDVIKFAAKTGVNYPILYGSQSVADQFGGIEFLPTTYYIDREGIVVERVLGQPNNRDEVEKNVKLAIAAKPGT